jgi:hypothetical protein
MYAIRSSQAQMVSIDRRIPPTEEGAGTWSGPFLLSGALYLKPAWKMLGKIQHFDNG